MFNKIAGWCTPDTEETSKTATKAGNQTPSRVESNSSYTPRLSITSNSAPIKFILPKRQPIVHDAFGDPDLSTEVMILEDREITVDKKKSEESLEPGLTKQRDSIDFSKDIREQLRLEDLSSSRTVGHEENKDQPIYSHRQAQSIDLSMTVRGLIRGQGSKSCSRKGDRQMRRVRSRSSLMRKSSTLRRATTSPGRMRSISSNTPRSGSIQKEFRIGENSFSAKTFMEKKISC